MVRPTRQGQISIVIIIGLLLIIIGGLGYYLTRSQTTLDQTLTAPVEFRPVEQQVRDCLATALTKGATVVGAQGGYLFAPQDAVRDESNTIAYGVRDKDVTLPSITSIEQDIALYISSTLPACVDTAALRQQGFAITTIPPVVDVTAAQDLRATIDWRATITKGPLTYTIGKQDARVPIPLGPIYLSVASATKQIASDTTIDITALAQDQFSHEIILYDESTFLLVTRTGNISSDSYTFITAIHATANRAPLLDAPATVQLARDEVRTIDLHASDPDGDPFTVTTSSPIASIKDNKLVLRSSSSGDYTLLVTAEDDKYAATTAQITVQVGP